MLFNVDKLTGTADITTVSIDLAYCMKPSRPAWDKDGNYGNYVNLGIDSLVVTFNPEQASELSSLVFGSEKELTITGGTHTIKATFKVVELTRVNSTTSRIYFMPVEGTDIIFA